MPMSTARRTSRARVGALSRHYPGQPELAEQERAELRALQLEDHVREVASLLPAARRERIALLLLRPGVPDDA